MSVIDKIVNEWAFRCKKGYPDMNNPADIKILKEIYSQFGIVLEEATTNQILKGATFNLGGNSWVVTKDSTDDNVEAINQKKETKKFTKKDFITAKVFPTNPKGKNTPAKEKAEKAPREKKIVVKTTYDQLIAYKLKQDTIPPVEGDYKLTTSHGTIKITNDHDRKIFSELYKIAPPTAGQGVDAAGSKGSGHGEIALYWLLKFQKDPYTVEDSRGGGSADLLVNGIGVEVKAFPKGETIQLGRVGKYTTQLTRLNTIFGVNALITDFSGGGKKTLPPNAIHASSKDIEEACEHVLEVSKHESLRMFNMPFITSMFNKIDEVLSFYGNPTDAKELASKLLRDLLVAKFIDKPIGSGEAGYVINVSPHGDLEYTYITKVGLQTLDLDKVYSGVFINQGMINFNKNIFN
jgi:hypothetical protein